jgi:low affinity Fe/Cu permease
MMTPSPEDDAMTATAKQKHPVFRLLERLADFSSTPTGLAVAFLGIAFWAAAGVLLHFPEGWRLMIDTVANIATLVVVFLIQNTQRSVRRSLEAKLDLLIEKASTRPLTGKDIEKIVNENIQAHTREFVLFKNAFELAKSSPAILALARFNPARTLRSAVH